MQNSKKIDIPPPAFEGISASSAITPEFCLNQFKAFGDKDRFNEVGGFPLLNKALAIPMVLVMSIWDDVSSHPEETYPPHVKIPLTTLISTTRICSGWTPRTRQRKPVPPAATVAIVPRAQVLPRTSRATFPTRTYHGGRYYEKIALLLTRFVPSQVIWSNIRFGPVGSTVKA